MTVKATPYNDENKEEKSMGKQYEINVYGDSVLKGIMYDPEKGKYVPGHGTAVEALAKLFGLLINNYSKFGATVDDIRKLIESDLQKGYGCDCAVIELGGNDCDHDWAAISADPYGVHHPKVKPDEYERKLTQLVGFLKSNNITPILTTIPPVDPDRYLDHICHSGLNRENILKWLGGTAQTISHTQELYSAINERVAKNTGCMICDCRTPFLSKRYFSKLMCDDGIHPSKKGQMLITSAFYRFIEENFPEAKAATTA